MHDHGQDPNFSNKELALTMKLPILAMTFVFSVLMLRLRLEKLLKKKIVSFFF